MVNGLRSVQKKLEDLSDAIEDGTDEGASDGLEEVEEQAKANLRRNDSNYRYEVYGSIRQLEAVDNGNVRTHRLVAGGPSAPQARYLEDGTGTYYEGDGTPIPSPKYLSSELVANIQDWIDTKNIQAMYVPQDELSWAISRTIVAKGTPAQPFFGPAWFQKEPTVSKSVKKGMQKEISNV